MDLIANLALGFETALSPANLMYCLLGVSLGTLIGVLPGIGSLAAIAMLMPISFHLDPISAMVLLAGVFYGSEYGGSIASILLNLPGTPSAAVTCLDGHPLAKQGRAGMALFVTMFASFVGAATGIFLLSAFAPALAGVALAFGAADYFAIMLLGLVAAAAIGRGSPVKGVAMVALGVLLGCVGVDLNTGMVRYTFGSFYLLDGISIVALAMGLFGFAEVMASMDGAAQVPSARITLRSMLPTRAELLRLRMPMLRGSAIGSFFGAMPGTGQTIASFFAYALEKRTSRNSAMFGHGAVEGIAAPEAAGNAAVQTAFIPTLTMGIPGSATMALMLGALMMHGITPGPRMLTEHPDVFWGLVPSFWIGNILLVILNIPFIGIWVRILQIPSHMLYPGIILLICIGVFSLQNNIFDVLLALGFGLVGYGIRLLGFEPASLLIGFVLGPLMEENFRRAMIIGRGELTSLVATPIAATLMSLTALLLVWSLWATIRSRNQRHILTDD